MASYKDIGAAIDSKVPERFHHFFAHGFTPAGDVEPDALDWWAWAPREGDTECPAWFTVKLIDEAVEFLAKTPDSKPSNVEAVWQSVGDQCLTWAFG